jgi:G patch domain/KOW motif-containing protein
VDAVLLQKLKDILERLLEDHGMEEFTDVPVEGFGATLLADYGWHKGSAVRDGFA